MIGANSIGDNSTITGNMSGYGLIIGASGVGDNSTINGKSVSRGLISISPTGISLGTRIETFENYVYKSSEKEKK